MGERRVGEARGGGVGVGGHLCIGSSGFLSSRPAEGLGTEPTRPSPAAGLKLMDPLPSLLSSLLGSPPSLWPVCLSPSKWQGRTVIHSVTPPSIHRDIHRSEEHRTCMSLLHAHIATLWQKWVNPAADSPLLQQNARFSRQSTCHCRSCNRRRIRWCLHLPQNSPLLGSDELRFFVESNRFCRTDRID